jgi:hypothetical protein
MFHSVLSISNRSAKAVWSGRFECCTGMKEKQHLIGPLAYWLAAGKLDARSVLPAIEKLAEDSPKSLPALLEVLEGETDGVLISLARYLRQTLRKEALRVRQARRQELPVGDQENLSGLVLATVEAWKVVGDPTAVVESAVRMSRDLAFLAANQEKAPRLFREVQQQSAKALADAGAVITELVERLPKPLVERLANAWADDMPGRDRVLVQLEERRSVFQQNWFEQAGQVVRNMPEPGELETTPGTLAARFAAAEARDEKARVVDLACCWMTPAAVPALGGMSSESWVRDRALWNLTLRFGNPGIETWEDWQRWLAGQEHLWQSEQEAFCRLMDNHAAGLLLVWYSQLPDPDPAVLDALVRRVAESGKPVVLSELFASWAKWVPLHERRALMGFAEPIPPVIAAGGVAVESPGVAARGPIQAPPLLRPQVEPAAVQPGAAPFQSVVAEVAPPVPPKPSVWEVHIQPFFVENWYIVAGIAMVILGSSLLAYYTWDKHWLVRYTLMPLLLGVFTWSLAGVGNWIEKKSAEFKGTAAILRGAAIGLLPINFMAMALLSADEKVPQKGPALLAMALIYLSVFGWGLRKWCAAVDKPLGTVLGGTLLLLNALVAVGPLARTVGHLEGQSLLLCLGAGFYAGFAATAGAIVFFTRKILTRQMAEEKRVPWFVAGALAITFLEVFIWVHGFMRHLPQAPTYALMVILTGWLILYSERRALQLKESPQLHGGESFLGFGMILLGLLMGFSEPIVRIASFLTAGSVWMYQGLWRRHPLHDWIALTLLGLGGALVGLLPQYPGPWLPLLGVLLALGFGLGGWISRKRRTEEAPVPSTSEAGAPTPGTAASTAMSELAQACRGMQMVALVITAVIAPLVQWHYQCQPLGTAGWLVLVAMLFGWRAFRDQQIHWLHATMAILALALPYAGFMDVAGRSPHNNTMFFGLAILSWLWLGVTWIARKPLVLQARSTVLWLYGMLAVAAMLLRVALGDTAPEPLWYRDYMDYGGPLLMMLALIPATYFSRSLVPAGMAVAIMVILFPELKANLQLVTPWLSWGTGLGSSAWGLALTGLCFLLRPREFLKDLPEGDRFMGKELFPIRRHDHTLFTWPIMAAAVYLLIKVDTWHLVRNLVGSGIPLKTALALGITGVAWTFTAIYHRRHRAAVMGVHLGWLCGLAGLSLGYWHQADQPRWTWPALVMGLLLQGLYWYYRFGLEPARAWVRALLTEPTRKVLLAGSAVLAIVCMGVLLDGAALEWTLYGFVAAQVIWHALRTRQWFWGVALFFQSWIGLLAFTAPGSGPLWDRVSVERSLSPTLWLLFGIQALFVALELTQRRRSEGAEPTPDATQPAASEVARTPGALLGFCSPVLTPVFVLATTLTAFLGLTGLLDGVHGLSLSGPQQVLLLSTLLLTARAQASNLILLPALLLTYVMIHHDQLASLAILDGQLELLATPWRLGLLGLGIAVVTQAGRWVHQRNPKLLAGAFALPVLTATSCAWLFWPATALSGTAALYHTAHPVLRESGAQLWAPYLGTLTFLLVAWFWRQAGFFAGAGLLLLLGNIHLVRVFGGEFLRGHGLSEQHLICLGLGITLLQASVLRRTIRSSAAVSAINRASLGLAGLILALLSANYFTEPNLAGITPMRFIVSGTLAWLAGWYFRRAARHPGPGEETHTDLCEALYHFGLVVALWCAALLVPWFRQPLFALAALCLPVAYFYGRAELGMRQGRMEARRYRNSAAVLGFAVLGLYVFKAVFHLVLFPGAPISTQHYHYNAPLILLLGLVLLRLHGLGGTGWLAFYGGLALMTGSYFMLTALPGLSPFDYPMPSAWCALGLGHFWILLSYARSPLRTFIQRLARLDDSSWDSLRRSWGRCLLAATQGATLWGLFDYSGNTFIVAPLLAGAATVFLHQGILRRSPLYLIVAGLELTAALHMGFLLPSYLPKDDVIWVILGIWLVLLAAFEFLPRKLQPGIVGRIAAVLGALVLAHVLYHRPWLPVGLWGMGLGALLAAWNPLGAPRVAADVHSHPNQASSDASEVEKAFAALLLLIPSWLVYFSQARFEQRGVDAALESWPVLASTVALFLTGLAGRLFPAYWAAGYHSRARTQRRLFDVMLGWLETGGCQLHQATVWIATTIVVAVQVLHYSEAFAGREFGLLILLEAALAVAWFFEGKDRQSMLANYLMQLCAVGCFAAIRRQLMLTTGWWTYEYDVWASLAFSFGLAGAKQVLDLQPRTLWVPLLTTLCALPVMALVWVVVHGLGVNLALMVVGLQSVLFAFLGKDNRESPYNILALAGFVGFILLTFYSKLQLRVVHAYIIPVGLGVLVLQELFKKRMQPEAHNWIRLVVLMAMLGSTGYYALADTSHAITFNMTMILLCLLSMGLGSLLRIRLYLALGFAGLMVDLVSLLYKVLVLMERSARMTVVGSLVLLIGALLVFGAIYYKTSKPRIDALVSRWQLKLAQWQ